MEPGHPEMHNNPHHRKIKTKNKKKPQTKNKSKGNAGTQKEYSSIVPSPALMVAPVLKAPAATFSRRDICFFGNATIGFSSIVITLKYLSQLDSQSVTQHLTVRSGREHRRQDQNY